MDTSQYVGGVEGRASPSIAALTGSPQASGHSPATAAAAAAGQSASAQPLRFMPVNPASYGSDSGSASASTTKRSKTGRACDPCRRKKIRCDLLALPSQAEHDGDGRTGSIVCANCHANHLACTFHLPITETRFKRKSSGDHKITTTSSPPSSLAMPLIPSSSSAAATASNVLLQNHQRSPHVQSSPHRINAIPHLLGQPNSPSFPPLLAAPPPHAPPLQTRISDESLLRGNTNLSYLLHSTMHIPPHSFDELDRRHHYHWELDPSSGHGFIRIKSDSPLGSRKSSTANGLLNVSDPLGSSLASASPIIDQHGEDTLPTEWIERLVNDYFSNSGSWFPLISKYALQRIVDVVVN